MQNSKLSLKLFFIVGREVREFKECRDSFVKFLNLPKFLKFPLFPL